MRFQIVIPTFRRPAKLEQFFESLVRQKFDTNLISDDNDNHVSIHLTVYFDNNDVTSYDYFNKKFGSYFKTSYILLETQHRAFGVWNRHLEKMYDTDAMFYMCDDIELHEDFIAVATTTFIKKFPDTDGLMGINQVNIPKDKEGFSRNAMGVIGKKFAERFPNRKCFCPDYTSFHADAELGNFARSIGKFHYCDDAKITHYHPAYFKNLVDETHNIVREVKSLDKEVWNLRQQRKLLWGHSFELVR